MHPRPDPHGRPYAAPHGDGYGGCHYCHVGQHLVLVFELALVVYHGASYQER